MRALPYATGERGYSRGRSSISRKGDWVGYVAESGGHPPQLSLSVSPRMRCSYFRVNNHFGTDSYWIAPLYRLLSQNNMRIAKIAFRNKVNKAMFVILILVLCTTPLSLDLPGFSTKFTVRCLFIHPCDISLEPDL